MTSAELVGGDSYAVPLSEQGPAPKQVVVGYGFWLFLLSDIIIFGALFAAYAVLSGDTNGGPPGTALFDKMHVLIGTGFLSLESTEFPHMLATGNGPSRSAFLSSFFALVGTHGLHVTAGLIWLVVLAVQGMRHRDLTERDMIRLTCLSLFWHFLDVVWIGVFPFVYLASVI